MIQKKLHWGRVTFFNKSISTGGKIFSNPFKNFALGKHLLKILSHFELNIQTRVGLVGTNISAGNHSHYYKEIRPSLRYWISEESCSYPDTSPPFANDDVFDPTNNVLCEGNKRRKDEHWIQRVRLEILDNKLGGGMTTKGCRTTYFLPSRAIFVEIFDISDWFEAINFLKTVISSCNFLWTERGTMNRNRW